LLLIGLLFPGRCKRSLQAPEPDVEWSQHEVGIKLIICPSQQLNYCPHCAAAGQHGTEIENSMSSQPIAHSGIAIYPSSSLLIP
jgi:hypothetical protein